MQIGGYSAPQIFAVGAVVNGEDVRAALGRSCPVCGARKGVECWNTISPGEPLPGRRVHYGRVDRWDHG